MISKFAQLQQKQRIASQLSTSRILNPQMMRMSSLTQMARINFSSSGVKIPKNHNLQGMISWYQSKGHNYAQTDPLMLQQSDQGRSAQKRDMDHWQVNEFESLDSYPLDYRITQTLQDKCAAVKDVHEYLNETYCGSVGVEFEHVPSEDERLWCYENYERIMAEPVSKEEKVKALQLLIRTENMEQFMQKKFATHKRYSSEGSEAITVAINTLIAEASKPEAKRELESVVLGMPHRGRLATLVVLNDYPFRNLLYKASGKNDVPEDIVDRIDDIPTHIAVSNTKKFSTAASKQSKNKKVTLTMVHNPSHLESQNAISMGKTRAKLDDFGAESNKAVLNIQSHGDAAFPGQGAAYEALTLSKLPKFQCNGSIHIITNNQVGFTTNPEDDRSFKQSADIVKPFGVPILRVNTSDPEAVIKVCKFMIKYWEKFQKDVLIDMIGYRYYGHNEVDEPSFTQPVMYKKIRSLETPPQRYANSLIKEGVVSDKDLETLRSQINTHFEAEYQASLSLTPDIQKTRDPTYRGSRSLTHKWADMEFSQWGSEAADTGYATDMLKKIGLQSVTIPDGFNVHPRLQKMFIDSRKKSIEKDNIDWATSEAMALVSLAQQGFNSRLVGEDSERGTFSQRHFIYHDQTNGSKCMPLQNFEGVQGRFQIANTNLCELGTMAYEYGYSLESPKNLCLWEAQFGDFYNPAQLIIDQYLMCSEAKWLRQSGLILLLPHGFDGAGPEHSTCHMERFLQNVNSQAYDNVAGSYDDLTPQSINFQVAQCTTPANYFHILRRQMLRNFRKPLVIAAPKIGLKHPKAVSNLSELAPGTTFTPTISQEFGDLSGHGSKVILCSGKVAFDIESKLQDVSKRVKVVRIEEVAPFPVQSVREHLMGPYSNADVYWVQEEPVNQGAFQFAKLHVDRVLDEMHRESMNFIGRRSVHSYCTGAASDYKKEGEKLWADFDSHVIQS